MVGRRVVLFEPRSKVGGCGEEGRFVLRHARLCQSVGQRLQGGTISLALEYAIT